VALQFAHLDLIGLLEGVDQLRRRLHHAIAAGVGVLGCITIPTITHRLDC
jgi:hypothetical protein